MTRELKFRAYQKYHEKLVPVKNIEWKDGELYSVTLDYGNTCIPRIITYSNAFGDYWLNDENGSVLEVSQFTGVFDKNGTPVYEGDVLKGHYWNYGKKRRFIGKVVYGMHGFTLVGVKQYLGMSQDFCSLYEIIGNIYENHELLEQTS